MRTVDVVVKVLVLAPSALLVATLGDLGGVQARVSTAVVSSAETVARPVADELLERLPWPGPRRPTCVYGPYAVGDPCAVAQGAT